MSYRLNSTKTTGNKFSDTKIQLVWEKGQIIPNLNKDEWRKDFCGILIKRDAYGDTLKSVGWEIDHIKPVSKKGTDELNNLQPLQWENNRHKSDDYPDWSCKLQNK